MPMRNGKAMRSLARWHIWLGWLIGVPLILWTATGLLMTLRPIEEVRGNHLQRDIPAAVIAPGASLRVPVNIPARRIVLMPGPDGPFGVIEAADGRRIRFDPASGETLPGPSSGEIRAVVASRIVGGRDLASLTFHKAASPPFDWRRAEDIWQATLRDGTHVYVDPVSAEISAVRTPFWRVFDFAWGLHIMDLQTREDTHHPILIAFAAVALGGTFIGFILLFRRRRSLRRS